MPVTTRSGKPLAIKAKNVKAADKISAPDPAPTPDPGPDDKTAIVFFKDIKNLGDITDTLTGCVYAIREAKRDHKLFLLVDYLPPDTLARLQKSKAVNQAEYRVLMYYEDVPDTLIPFHGEHKSTRLPGQAGPDEFVLGWTEEDDWADL